MRFDKVIVISTFNPNRDFGSSQRLRNMISGLKGDFELTNIILDRSTKLGPNEELIEGVQTLKIGVRLRPLSKFFVLLCTLLGLRPTNIDFRRTTEARKGLNALIKNSSSQTLLWCFDLFTYFSLPLKIRRQCQVIVDLSDYIPARLLSESRLRGDGVLRAFFLRCEKRSYDRLYRKAIETSWKSLISSFEDKQHLNSSAVIVIPNSYSPTGDAKLRQGINLICAAKQPGVPEFLFVGSMNYEPNNDAAYWLQTDIWQKLHGFFEGSSLAIVGRKAWSVDCGVEGIQVFSDVPGIGRFYHDNVIALVPLRFASGSRIKILEAWALGVPVISTSVGAEGLEFIDGTNILIANTSDEFLLAAHRLTSEPELRKSICENAFNKYLLNYSATTIHTRISEILNEGDSKDRQPNREK